MRLYSDFGNLDRIPDGEIRKLPTKASDIGALSTSGGTLTGSLYLKGNPTQNKEAATKEYVDSAVSGGGQVQSNWQENDSTQKDYIKNRTHWKEETTGSGYTSTTFAINAYVQIGSDVGVTWGDNEMGYSPCSMSGTSPSLPDTVFPSSAIFYIPKSSTDSTLTPAQIVNKSDELAGYATYCLLPVDTTILPDNYLIILNKSGDGYTLSNSTIYVNQHVDVPFDQSFTIGIPNIVTTYHKLDTNYIPWNENPNPGFEHPIILEENTDYGATDPTSPQTGQLFFNTGNTLADLIYPIGSVYISVNNTSPATLFGGTWTKINEKFLLSSSTNYPSGSTGGEATHKLTKSELPYFEEPVRVAGETELNFTSQGGTATGSADMLMHTAQWSKTASNPSVTATNRMYVQITGGNQAHNNMPPYMVVNMWYRTA